MSFCLVYFNEISLSMIYEQTYFIHFIMCYLHHLFIVTYPFKYHFLITSTIDFLRSTVTLWTSKVKKVCLKILFSFDICLIFSNNRLNATMKRLVIKSTSSIMLSVSIFFFQHKGGSPFSDCESRDFKLRFLSMRSISCCTRPHVFTSFARLKKKFN